MSWCFYHYNCMKIYIESRSWKKYLWRWRCLIFSNILELCVAIGLVLRQFFFFSSIFFHKNWLHWITYHQKRSRVMVSSVEFWGTLFPSLNCGISCRINIIDLGVWGQVLLFMDKSYRVMGRGRGHFPYRIFVKKSFIPFPKIRPLCLNCSW